MCPVASVNAANWALVTQVGAIRKAGRLTVRTGLSPSYGLARALSVPIRNSPAGMVTISSPEVAAVWLGGLSTGDRSLLVPSELARLGPQQALTFASSQCWPFVEFEIQNVKWEPTRLVTTNSLEGGVQLRYNVHSLRP